MPLARSHRLAALASVLALCPFAPAEAQEQPKRPLLAVLPIIVAGPHGSATLSSVIDDIAHAASLRRLALISTEEMASAGSGDLSTKVRACGSDTVCISDRLRRFDARYGLLVVVDASLDPPLIGLQLLDTDERRMIASSIGDLEPSEGSVSAAVRGRATKLFEEAGWGQLGRLIVDVSPAQAKVAVADVVPEQGAPNVFTLNPGRYIVEAELAGYTPSSTEAVIIGGQETRVGIVLAEDRSILASPWFWTAIGVVAAGGATAAILATRSPTRCLCFEINGRGCELCPQ